MVASVSTLHLVALFLPIIGVTAVIILFALFGETWYPIAVLIFFSPILLCTAIPGMIIAIRLPSSDGAPHVIKILALLLNGVTLAPFVAWIVWLWVRKQ